jgi:hypothetical protein
VQFRLAPRRLPLQTRIRNVLAPAYDGIRGWQVPQFWTHTKCSIHVACKASRLLPSRKQSTGFFHATGGGKTCNLSLEERRLNASNAGRFTRTEDAFDGRALKLVNAYVTSLNLATQQYLQLYVRNQMEAASQEIALGRLRFSAS